MSKNPKIRKCGLCNMEGARKKLMGNYYCKKCLKTMKKMTKGGI